MLIGRFLTPTPGSLREDFQCTTGRTFRSLHGPDEEGVEGVHYSNLYIEHHPLSAEPREGRNFVFPASTRLATHASARVPFAAERRWDHTPLGVVQNFFQSDRPLSGREDAIDQHYPPGELQRLHGARSLDLCTGSGALVHDLVNDHQSDAHGLDVYLRPEERRLPNFRLAEIQETGYPADSFDHVICTYGVPAGSYIKDVSQRELTRIILEAERITRGGGTILISPIDPRRLSQPVSDAFHQSGSGSEALYHHAPHGRMALEIRKPRRNSGRVRPASRQQRTA